ncbi:carbonic anhydrase [Leucobacter manosquensis]|uniref:carbonic anhydrase n=1 Tax=Leucobacter manosquensis TaxID=2810611 RepID=A0ABS5M3N3_9MICO|nr:carbonic anhydrase [Leucobacter manosquensis]MBS3181807.1 carbonic anhydrase [Leucobacter manosquensis]
MTAPRVTPQQAWDALVAGNRRFIDGGPQHPRQDVERRNELTNGQVPDAALFGCSDSRLAAEIIFDAGLGDLFIARNMGHVVAESITASMEYAVANLGVAVIVVLAHDSCGAVAAAIGQMEQEPPAVPIAVQNTLAPILPSVQELWLREHRDTPYVDVSAIDADAVGRVHLSATVNQLLRSSRIISDAVAAGRLGIVGCQYQLSEGRAVAVSAVGHLDITAAEPVAAA